MSEEAYLIKDIDQPIETVAIVYEAALRARNGPLCVFLEHHERPNVIRGRRQPLERPDMPEYKRPDTGRSWHHWETRCFMEAKPVPDRNAQQQWGERMIAQLCERGYKNDQLAYSNADILFCNGAKKHLMGTSIYVPEDRRVQVLRACWYERNPLPEISDLLRADGIDPAEFEKCNGLVNGEPFHYLVKRHTPKMVAAKDFISKSSMLEALGLQNEKGGDVRGSCVTDWKR